MSVRQVLDAVASVSMIGASVALTWRTLSGRYTEQTSGSASVIARAPIIEDVEAEGIEIALPDRLGVQPAGRLLLLEFADFECPYSAEHARQVLPRILHTYVDRDRLTYIFLSFPLEALHPSAVAASQAAECAAEQGRFWEMHSILFSSQSSFGGPALRQYAEDLNLDMSRFDSCLRRDETAGRVARDIAEGRRVGVTGTPTFFIGRPTAGNRARILRRIRGAAPFETFAHALTELLREPG